MGTELIGWTSSALIVVTLALQVREQWRLGTSKGVSQWLFVGQFAASSGFMAYSMLVHNWVFLTTNVLMALNALAGLSVLLYHRRHQFRSSEDAA